MCTKSNPNVQLNKKAFFLRHTARLPSSTSQLVWSLPWGGGGDTWALWYPGAGGGGYLGAVVPWHSGGGGGSSSTSTLGGGGPLPSVLLGGSSSTSTLAGSHVTYSHDALDVTSLLSRHQLMGLS